MQAVGAGYSAMSAISAAKYGKQVADFNAAIGEAQAADAIERGTVAANRHRTGVRQLIGAQRTSMGAQGQDPNDPDSSAMDIQLDSAQFGELDAITIYNDARREAWGYQVGAQDSRVRGQIAVAEGRNRAVGTILTTSADFALRKYGFPVAPVSELAPGQYSTVNRQYG